MGRLGSPASPTRSLGPETHPPSTGQGSPADRPSPPRIGGPGGLGPEGLWEFLHVVDALKGTVRRGWVREGVREPESVADHTFGLALLALVLPLPAGVDRDRLLRLAVVHDLAEARVGDLTPGELPPDEKHALERAAMTELAALLPNGGELLDLWAEYEADATPTARFAHDLDRLEMLLQALAYEEAGNPGPLDSFWEAERNRVRDPGLAAFLRYLESRRRGNRA